MYHTLHTATNTTTTLPVIVLHLCLATHFLYINTRNTQSRVMEKKYWYLRAYKVGRRAFWTSRPGEFWRCLHTQTHSHIVTLIKTVPIHTDCSVFGLFKTTFTKLVVHGRVLLQVVWAWEFLVVIPLLHITGDCGEVDHACQHVHGSTHQHGGVPATSL